MFRKKVHAYLLIVYWFRMIQKLFTLQPAQDSNPFNFCMLSKNDEPFRRYAHSVDPGGVAVPTDCSLRSLVEILFYHLTMDISIGNVARAVAMNTIFSRPDPNCQKKYKIRIGSLRGETPTTEPITALVGKLTLDSDNQLGGAMVYVVNILVLSYEKWDFHFS